MEEKSDTQQSSSEEQSSKEIVTQETGTTHKSETSQEKEKISSRSVQREKRKSCRADTTPKTRHKLKYNSYKAKGKDSLSPRLNFTEIDTNADLGSNKQSKQRESKTRPWSSQSPRSPRSTQSPRSHRSPRSPRSQELVSLDEIISGLTSESNHKAASRLSLDTGKLVKSITLMDFLLTYRLYCKPEELLHLLTKRFHQKGDSKEEGKLIKERVLSVIQDWVTNLGQDFLDPSLISEVVEFLNSLRKKEKFIGLAQTIQSLEDSLSKLKKRVPLIVPIHKSPLNHTVSILDFEPTIVAQNLNAIDTNLWKQFSPTQSWDTEYLKNIMMSWKSRLCSLVKTRILTGNNLITQLEQLKRFMEICDVLFSNKDNISNYHTVCFLYWMQPVTFKTLSFGSPFLWIRLKITMNYSSCWV
eukprot:TRINITY_DN3700_c1_g1_i3.p1 TRINITY_DN3700_c1_g1~~TRINITY_DN3700_c1_g1_i3.p1  ORF type:complete len:414 (-),score=58.29 TRINITY_DN3700_c1_g1_i3:459-1700(-)